MKGSFVCHHIRCGRYLIIFGTLSDRLLAMVLGGAFTLPKLILLL